MRLLWNIDDFLCIEQYVAVASMCLNYKYKKDLEQLGSIRLNLPCFFIFFSFLHLNWAYLRKKRTFYCKRQKFCEQI